MARYYVAESARGQVVLPISPELGRPEHHEFRWLTLEAAREIVPPRLLPVLHWVQTLVAD